MATLATVIDALTDLQIVLVELNGYQFEQVQDVLVKATGDLIDLVQKTPVTD